MAANNSKSRVESTAQELGLEVEILTMPASTRTAEDAANACGCATGQIVKSLIFEREDNGQLLLFLVAGDRQLDRKATAKQIGSKLKMADPDRVRKETGFAIGGVSPIGHLTPLPVYIDPHLLKHETVWAAAGAPNAVFSVEPNDLMQKCKAELLQD